MKNEFGEIKFIGTIDTIPDTPEPPRVTAIGDMVQIQFGSMVEGVYHPFYSIVIPSKYFYRITTTDTGLTEYISEGDVTHGFS